MQIKWNYIIIVFVAFYLFFGFLNSGETSYNKASSDYNRAFWVQELSKRNVLSVYEDFKKKNRMVPFDRQHFSAHVFGESIFEVVGTDGISVCDSSFGFGCFHGFFTRAVSQEGLSIVSALDDACVSAYGVLGTGCQHGIGHGIMEYLGYGDVIPALEACRDTTQVVPLLGCTSGVFMEYRKPVVIGEDSAEIIPHQFTADDPYTPCTRVPEKFRASCYFELADWWYSHFGSEYSAMGELCSASPRSYRKYCFLGIGSVSGPREMYDVSKSLATCAEVSDSPLEVRYCKSGAAWSFYANPESRNEYRTLCDGLPDGEILACLQDSDLTEGREQRTL